MNRFPLLRGRAVHLLLTARTSATPSPPLAGKNSIVRFPVGGVLCSTESSAAMLPVPPSFAVVLLYKLYTCNPFSVW